MDSNQLAQFRAIAECGSITKAAQKLFITQPALSIALNKLESDLKCRLFVRRGKQLMLTAEGQRLLDYAVTVTDTIQQAEEYFFQMNQNDTIRCFRIGGINYPIISNGCASVKDRYFSGILVTESDLRQYVESGEADIVLSDERHLSGAPAAYAKELLYHQSLLLVCPPSHPLADRGEVPVADLQGYAVVGHANPHGISSWIKEIKRLNHCNIREDANLNYTSWRTEGGRLPLPYFMNSFGISTVWEVVRNLRIIPVAGEYTQRDIFMWYLADQQERLSPIVQKIRENTQSVLMADQGYLSFIKEQNQ